MTISNSGPAVVSNTLVGIPQGTGEQERIGRKCTITNMHFRLLFTSVDLQASNLTAATLAHDDVRVIVYLDKQANGAQINGNDLLDADGIFEFRNLANSKRFKVLKDITFVFNETVIGAGNGTANDSHVVHKDKLVKFSLRTYIPIEYDSTLGALTEIRSNNIGLIVWTRAGGRVFLSTSSRVRVRFVDY